MDKQLEEKFWQDFMIPCQEDIRSVVFANPGDISRSLIKARNWTGIISQELIDYNKQLSEQKIILSEFNYKLIDLERTILGVTKIPGYATKNKEVQKTYIRQQASIDDRKKIVDLEKHINQTNSIIMRIMSVIERFEVMRKSIEKTTEWLIQYLNWYKFELKSFPDV